MSLYNNFGEESLREGARSTRPPPSYLTLTLTRMKMYKSDDQRIKSQSHSHSHSHSHSQKYLDLIFFFVLPRFACAIVTFTQPRYACLHFSFAQPRYACLLFTFAQPRYACVGLLCLLLTISSSFIAFHDFQKAAKSLQNRPKAAFLEKRACAFSHLLACAFDSKSVQNLNVSLCSECA